EGRLAHSWNAGIGVWPAFASDLAALALATLTLFEAEPDPDLIAEAQNLLSQLAHFHSADESELLAMNASDADALPIRPRPLYDDAVPNANGLYAEALIRHAAAGFDHQS